MWSLAQQPWQQNCQMFTQCWRIFSTCLTICQMWRCVTSDILMWHLTNFVRCGNVSCLTFLCHILGLMVNGWTDREMMTENYWRIKLEKRRRRQGPRDVWIHHHSKNTRSRSYQQGQRSHEQNVMPMCTYPSWVVHDQRRQIGINTLNTAAPKKYIDILHVKENTHRIM